MSKYTFINGEAILALVLCLGAAVSSTRLFVCRAIGLSVESLYCWSAILPFLLLYPVLYLGAQPAGRGTDGAFSIVLAFGLGFSLASIRTPKLYARIAGIICFLIYATLFYAVIRVLRAHGTAA
jgi:hypothetical protein